MAVTVEAKWIAMKDFTTIYYDSYGKSKKNDVTRQAVGVYDKAAICLQMLRTQFSKEQKKAAELKARINQDGGNSYWFNAHFPFIETKMFMENIVMYHETEFFRVKKSKNNSV